MKYFFPAWRKARERARNRDFFLFFDYDGTLAPIAASPGKAKLSGKTRALLKKFLGIPGSELVVISGRSLVDIRKLVGLKGIIYAGNHGLEIEGPGIRFAEPGDAGTRSSIKRLKRELCRALSAAKGVLIEDKGLTFSVHYRAVRPADAGAVRDTVRRIAAPYIGAGSIKFSRGKKVFEIRPPLEWNKGKAVLWLLKKKTHRHKKRPLVICAGDDTTDEDAFRAIEGKGLSIYVGRARVGSAARYYLKNTGEVGELLEDIISLKAR